MIHAGGLFSQSRISSNIKQGALFCVQWRFLHPVTPKVELNPNTVLSSINQLLVTQSYFQIRGAIALRQ